MQGPHLTISFIKVMVIMSKAKKRSRLDISKAINQIKHEGQGEQGSVGIKPPRAPAEQKALQSASLSQPESNVVNFQLPLPVTGGSVTPTLVSLDPSELYVADYNCRVQSLLSTDDPDIQKLMKSIAVEGQRDPVLIRKVEGKDGYEEIYGSRRLFALSQINKEKSSQGLPTIKIICWLAEIPDADAERLSVSENDERTDISAFERALYYSGLHNKGLDVDLIATKSGVSLTSVRNYLRISSLPMGFIRLLPSPNELSVKSALQLLKTVKKTDSAKVEAFLVSVNHQKFLTSAELFKAFKAFAEPPKPKNSRQAKEFRNGKTKSLKAKVTQHRTNVGQFKVDLFDVTSQQQSQLEALLQSFLD